MNQVKKEWFIDQAEAFIDEQFEFLCNGLISTNTLTRNIAVFFRQNHLSIASGGLKVKLHICLIAEKDGEEIKEISFLVDSSLPIYEKNRRVGFEVEDFKRRHGVQPSVKVQCAILCLEE